MTRIVTSTYRYKRPSWESSSKLTQCLVIFGMSGMIGLAIVGPALSAENAFDGVYTGKRVLTKGSGPACPTEEDVSVTIYGATLTFTNSALRNFAMGFAPHPDGSFRRDLHRYRGSLRVYPGAHSRGRSGR